MVTMTPIIKIIEPIRLQLDNPILFLPSATFSITSSDVFLKHFSSLPYIAHIDISLLDMLSYS